MQAVSVTKIKRASSLYYDLVKYGIVKS